MKKTPPNFYTNPRSTGWKILATLSRTYTTTFRRPSPHGTSINTEHGRHISISVTRRRTYLPTDSLTHDHKCFFHPVVLARKRTNILHKRHGIAANPPVSHHHRLLLANTAPKRLPLPPPRRNPQPNLRFRHNITRPNSSHPHRPNDAPTKRQRQVQAKRPRPRPNQPPDPARDPRAVLRGEHFRLRITEERECHTRESYQRLGQTPRSLWDGSERKAGRVCVV